MSAKVGWQTTKLTVIDVQKIKITNFVDGKTLEDV